MWGVRGEVTEPIDDFMAGIGVDVTGSLRDMFKACTEKEHVGGKLRCG